MPRATQPGLAGAVTGGVAAPLLCRGEDRIWRVTAEIVRRAGGGPGIPLPPP